MSKRERNKAQNRAAILAAGREVFAELGYGAASVRDIIRRTDLASGTFYNYFPDKESVFRAIMDEIATATFALVREARERATTVEEFVEDGFRAYFESLTSDPMTFAIVSRNAGTIRSMFDEPMFGVGVTQLEEDMRAAIVRGDLPDIDVELMAASMAGAAIEIGTRITQEDGAADLDRAVSFVSELFLGGIARMAAQRATVTSG